VAVERRQHTAPDTQTTHTCARAHTPGPRPGGCGGRHPFGLWAFRCLYALSCYIPLLFLCLCRRLSAAQAQGPGTSSQQGLRGKSREATSAGSREQRAESCTCSATRHHFMCNESLELNTAPQHTTHRRKDLTP
jgi:hypothetical protein